MIIYDFRCSKCKTDYEAIFSSAKEAVKTLPCDNCGGEAVHIWKSFGAKGRNGAGDKGRYPRYEIQAGRTFHSRKEENAYLRSKGLVEMGPDEYRRSLSAPVTSHELPPMTDAMQEAWHETVEEGRVVPHKVVDTNSFKWIESQKEK